MHAIPSAAVAAAAPPLHGLTDRLFTAIAGPDALTLLPRAPDPAIDAYLQRAAAAGLLRRGWTLDLDAGEPLPPDLLPAAEGRDALAADIEALMALFAGLVCARRLRLRLEVLHRIMCSRFHTDFVGLRLLCTYRGAGTQWLDEGCADRSRLALHAQGSDDETSGVILDPAGVHEIARGTVALLKGAAWVDAEGRRAPGVLHRSPPVAAEDAPRVLLVIDSVF
ncbi:DUF1826 domain-containing protein [Derxia lacustris]|uniref:DUF1826 domain-containing protein n=1 Tax=Derxia lacustris TaxID=764842 RepID=UPI000A177D71|nr:DUF1826 domain-containing protein [Derxia lacustris]